MGKYITEKERYKIEILLKEKYSVAKIAKIIMVQLSRQKSKTFIMN